MSGHRGVIAAQEAQWAARAHQSLKRALALTIRERPDNPSARVVEHFRHLFASAEPASSLDVQIQALKEDNQRLSAAIEELRADSVPKDQAEALAAAAVEQAAEQSAAQLAERDAGLYRSLQDAATKARAAEEARAREAKQADKARAVAEAVTAKLAAANEALRAENERLMALNVDAEAQLNVRCSLCMRTSRLQQSQSELERFVAGTGSRDEVAAARSDGQKAASTEELATAARDASDATGNG